MRSYPYTVISCDIGGTSIASALVRYENNDMPKLIHQKSIPTEAAAGGSVVLDRLVEIVRFQLEYAQEKSYHVAGIGVDAAGCIDAETGSIYYAGELMPGWTGQRVCDRLNEEFGFPSALMGDVHAHALGEARWGAAKNLGSALVVASGTGLGGAYVLDSKVVRGAHGAAGHLGHSLSPEAFDYICSCGHKGHIESVASGTGIGALYQGVSAMDNRYQPELDGAYVSKQAQQGEAHAQEVLYNSGFALGKAIGSWVNIFDPEAVILSGSVLAAGDIWRNAVTEGFKTQVIYALRETPILSAALENGAPLIGAAENLIDTLCDNE